MDFSLKNLWRLLTNQPPQQPSYKTSVFTNERGTEQWLEFHPSKRIKDHFVCCSHVKEPGQEATGGYYVADFEDPMMCDALFSREQLDTPEKREALFAAIRSEWKDAVIANKNVDQTTDNSLIIMAWSRRHTTLSPI